MRAQLYRNVAARGSDNVSFLSPIQRIPDQEGQPYLRVITRISGDSYRRLTRAKQPRVMIEARIEARRR